MRILDALGCWKKLNTKTCSSFHNCAAYASYGSSQLVSLYNYTYHIN
jgi:hypothetical protein